MEYRELRDNDRFKKIFLDTSPIVYYLENNELYYSQMKRFQKMYEECDYITSTMTITEYLTYPYKQNNVDMIMFLTNDKQLKQFKEMDCITVEELS